MPAGEYHVALGLYHFESGERLPVRDVRGQDIAGATVVLEQTFEVE